MPFIVDRRPIRADQASANGRVIADGATGGAEDTRPQLQRHEHLVRHVVLGTELHVMLQAASKRDD
jgi:hypothetical protein